MWQPKWGGFVVVGTLVWVGCSSTTSSQGGCTQGGFEACLCDDGSSSRRTCGADGEFGPCECAGGTGGAASGGAASGGAASGGGGASGGSPPVGGTAGTAGSTVGVIVCEDDRCESGQICCRRVADAMPWACGTWLTTTRSDPCFQVAGALSLPSALHCDGPEDCGPTQACCVTTTAGIDDAVCTPTQEGVSCGRVAGATLCQTTEDCDSGMTCRPGAGPAGTNACR